ncbi:hypothetical protein BCR33DRAFT_745439 [Rhizoclosmatium globosum]|uniref:L domain-like protein n=1 Tax=Rhizoclosmatium globosum TaxID=329046 RepID=A0A1Y2B2M6_9FUNG|nr:hypothetical protein BCR33DRAFT_745439 [Rhizoclosmatium globosum]|eukprot:ORY29088.1 hypothetical protein BCR33DRAFT_745439 [Rhizoclosmatium globosum]
MKPTIVAVSILSLLQSVASVGGIDCAQLNSVWPAVFKNATNCCDYTDINCHGAVHATPAIYTDDCYVACDSNFSNRITQIRLLRSTLPSQQFPDLSRFDGLTFVYLESNSFIGTLPLNLPSNIEVFHVPFNKMTGNIPNWSLYAQLTFLKHSDVAYQLNSVVRAYIQSGFIRLTYLYNTSEFTNLTGTLPSTFPQTLTVFKVNDNNIGGTIPSSFTSSNLKTFQVANNKLTGVFPKGPSSLNATAPTTNVNSTVQTSTYFSSLVETTRFSSISALTASTTATRASTKISTASTASISSTANTANTANSAFTSTTFPTTTMIPFVTTSESIPKTWTIASTTPSPTASLIASTNNISTAAPVMTSSSAPASSSNPPISTKATTSSAAQPPQSTTQASSPLSADDIANQIAAGPIPSYSPLIPLDSNSAQAVVDSYSTLLGNSNYRLEPVSFTKSLGYMQGTLQPGLTFSFAGYPLAGSSQTGQDQNGAAYIISFSQYSWIGMQLLANSSNVVVSINTGHTSLVNFNVAISKSARKRAAGIAPFVINGAAPLVPIFPRIIPNRPLVNKTHSPLTDQDFVDIAKSIIVPDCARSCESQIPNFAGFRESATIQTLNSTCQLVTHSTFASTASLSSAWILGVALAIDFADRFEVACKGFIQPTPDVLAKSRTLEFNFNNTANQYIINFQFSVTDITNTTTYAGLPYPEFNDVLVPRDLIDSAPLMYDGCGPVIAHMKYDICEGSVIGSNVCNGTFTPHLKFPEYDLTQIPGSGYDSQSCKAKPVDNGGGKTPVTTPALILGGEGDKGQGQGQNPVKTQSLAIVNDEPNYPAQIATVDSGNGNTSGDVVGPRRTVGWLTENSGKGTSPQTTAAVADQGNTGNSPVAIPSNPGTGNPGTGNPAISTAALQVDNGGSSAIQTVIVPQDSGTSQNQGTAGVIVSPVNLPVNIPQATAIVVIPDAPFVSQATSTRNSTHKSEAKTSESLVTTVGYNFFLEADTILNVAIGLKFSRKKKSENAAFALRSSHSRADVCEGDLVGNNGYNGNVTVHLKFPTIDLTKIPGKWRVIRIATAPVPAQNTLGLSVGEATQPVVPATMPVVINTAPVVVATVTAVKDLETKELAIKDLETKALVIKALTTKGLAIKGLIAKL